MKPEPKAHGLLFKGEMVFALLNTNLGVWPAEPIDREKPCKWQTRRGADITKPWEKHFQEGGCQQSDWNPVAVKDDKSRWLWQSTSHSSVDLGKCPHPIGSLIYAKEKHSISGNGYYFPDQTDGTVRHAWRPSIFMPKSAARIWLRVMNVRVERVKQISEDDAKAEGVTVGEDRSWAHKEAGIEYKPHVTAYSALWESINGKGSWEKNPWVWLYDLARISKP